MAHRHERSLSAFGQGRVVGSRTGFIDRLPAAVHAGLTSAPVVKTGSPDAYEGDALHAVLCAAGFNIRWLLRAIAKMGLAALLLALIALAMYAARLYPRFKGPAIEPVQ